MAAADLAPLPVGVVVLVVLADLVFAPRDRDRLGLPERERVDRARGPAPARGAMAVADALRIARDFERDSAAEALPRVGPLLLAHQVSRGSSCGRDNVDAVCRRQRCFQAR